MTDSCVKPAEGSNDATSLSLLERVKKQDQVAWNQFEQLYNPLILKWCKQWRLRDVDSENMRQEVLAAVFKDIGNFRRNPPHYTFRKWLRTITNNKVSDYWRRKKNQPDAVGGDDHQAWLNELAVEPEDDEAVAKEEESDVIRRALKLLQAEFKPETWQAWWRTAMEDQSIQDVAKEFGVSENVVYLARSHVRRRLETEFLDLVDLDL